jgi:hypothetical protein
VAKVLIPPRLELISMIYHNLFRTRQFLDFEATRPIEPHGAEPKIGHSIALFHVWISSSERPPASRHSTRPLAVRARKTPAAVDGELKASSIASAGSVGFSRASASRSREHHDLADDYDLTTSEIEEAVLYERILSLVFPYRSRLSQTTPRAR